MTARDNTERPITVELGTNILAGSDPDRVYEAAIQQLKSPKQAQEIPLWDGKAAVRMMSIHSTTGAGSQ